MATKPRLMLRELLRDNERLDMIEKLIFPLLEDIKTLVPIRALGSIRHDLTQITGEIRHFENQFREHMAPQKRRKFQKSTSEKDKGVTPV